MDLGQEIIQFTKDVLRNASSIDDAIDKALEPITDYTETIGDIISPIKSLIRIADLKRRLTLKSFISNYANKLYGEGDYEINEEETMKLQLFFQNKKHITYISEIIESAIKARSIQSTAILGVIAGWLIRNKTDLDHNYLSVIDSLRVMTDFDIENFIALYNYLPIIGKIHEDTDEYRTRDFYADENSQKIELDKNSLELTIEKLKRTNGLTYSEGGIGLAGNAKGAFETNATTEELYRLITTTKIID